MKSTGKQILTLFLIFWTVFTGYSFLKEAPTYVGQSYFDSNQFENDYYSFVEGLKQYILMPFDAEEAKESIEVTEEEIDYYRNYYGSLSDQVATIKEQYQEQLSKESPEYDEEVAAVLLEERNQKIADIKANFQDDTHVEEKIRGIKEQAIDKYASSWKNQRNNFQNQYNYFAYDFTNVDTGQNFLSGNVSEASVFKNKFGLNNSLLQVNNENYIYYDEFVENGEGLLYASFRINQSETQFNGTITIPKSLVQKSSFAEGYEAFTRARIAYFIIWGSGILTFILLLTVVKPSRRIANFFPHLQQTFNRWPLDVRIAIVIVLAMITLMMMENFSSTIYNISYYKMDYYYRVIETMILFIIMLVFFSATVFLSIWVADHIETKDGFQKQLNGAFIFKLADAFRESFLNRSIGKQSMVMLIVFFLAGMGFAGIVVEQSLLIIYIPLFFFVLIPTLYVFLRRMGYLNRIIIQTKDMAEGRLTSEIKVKGKSPLTEHARNLNDLRNGVRSSMTEQAKSERMKTELITNVSHDLRTPLTSIITYTDLLKNPELNAEDRAKYIEILDKKSSRLKILIEDLFEVSKMASGNIELIKQRVDLAQLLQQAVGEHEEDYAAAGLDLRVTISEQPIFAYVDGQKWWRIMDNLIINARKYSLPGSRVYVNLKVTGNEAEFIVKNVAKYELNEDATELVERFKRADTSRHTEGSGLGLAIAQSIVDLHGGRMNVSVDGDLFKVAVVINVAY